MPALPPKSPPTPTTPTIFLTPLTSTLISPVTPIINTRDITATTSISRSSSHQNIDTDSGKSSCSPALLDCSFDSGIGVDGEHGKNMKLHKCLQQWKRILIALERDKETYRMLRDRLSKIVDKKSKKQTNEETFCNVCCTEINLNNAKSFVTCCICKKHICRGAKCCDWLSKTAQWECQLCHSSKESLAQTSSWVAEQMSFNQQKLVYPMRARSEIYIPISDCNDGSMQFESVSQIGVNSSIDISAEQKVKIREYVEEVVANMLGGSLDSIRVEQMSKSENYLQLFHKYHSKLSNILINMENALWSKALKGDLPAVINGNSSRRSTNNLTTNTTTTTNNNNDHIDFADISQTRLRQLIESIIGETLRMSNISSSGAVSEIALDTYNARNKKDANRALPLTNGCVARRHRTEHYFEPQIYQDLLATAVLNKIVDNQGNNVRHLSESTPDLNSHTVDANFNVENRSTTSGSSVEPRSDCSSTDTEQRTNVGKGDDMSPCDSQQNLHADNITAALLTAGRESALSNYIAAHMVPLPDLSAAPTESEEDDYVSVTSSTLGEGTWEDNWLFKKKRASLKTPVTAGSVGMLVPAPKEDIRAQIGDKTADEVSDLSEMGSDTDESSMDLLRANLDPLNDRLLSKHLIGGQNTKQVLDEIMDRASMVSSTSPASNEPTYTETKNEHVVDAATKTEAVNTSVAQLQVPAANVEILTPPSEFKDLQAETIATSNPISGSIAEREYKKWNNAVEMPNNPYAPEALKRRISGSQERFIDLPNISPSTEKNPIDLIKSAESEIDADEQNRESDYKRYSRDYYINDDKQSTASSPKRKNSQDLLATLAISDDSTTDITINEPISPKLVEPETVYQALPAQVVEENASIETLSNQSLQSVNTTTSEDSDTVRIYDFNKQETTIIRDSKVTTETAPATATATTSIESATESCMESPKQFVAKQQRPTDLKFRSSASVTSSTIPSHSPFTPTRGSTPTAFKFLQPKRKLIEPGQVLSVDENEPQILTTPPGEKAVIEEEVAQVMPSVKALAQAFLLSSSKCSIAEKRWKSTIKASPVSPIKHISPTTNKKFEASPSTAEIAEDSTIASDLSSLETDPSIHLETETKDPKSPKTPITQEQNPTTSTTPAEPKQEQAKPAKTPSPLRRGFLKSNIAFFENLKFK